jgi:hypothetical protein
MRSIDSERQKGIETHNNEQAGERGRENGGLVTVLGDDISASKMYDADTRHKKASLLQCFLWRPNQFALREWSTSCKNVVSMGQATF